MPLAHTPPLRRPVTAPGGTAAADRCRLWYEAHGAAVYRYLRFHVESADVAEDLAADVFLRAFEAAERYDPAKADVHVWLVGIARNALRDHRRRQAVRRHVALGDLRDLRCDAPSPEERLLQEERAAALLAATRQLSEREQELLALRYGSEMSTAEIGAVLGIREAAVRTRLWRAVERLRELLVVEDRG